jgi:hypothetical protein
MVQSNTNRDEALSALEVLGFVRKEKSYWENSKEDPEASVESIIKKALKTYKGIGKLMHKIAVFLYYFVVLLHELKLKEPQDTIKSGFSLGKFKLRPTKCIICIYLWSSYDRYVYTNTVDGFSIITPIILTLKSTNDWF